MRKTHWSTHSFLPLLSSGTHRSGYHWPRASARAPRASPQLRRERHQARVRREVHTVGPHPHNLLPPPLHPQVQLHQLLFVLAPGCVASERLPVKGGERRVLPHGPLDWCRSHQCSARRRRASSASSVGNSDWNMHTMSSTSAGSTSVPSAAGRAGPGLCILQ